MAVRGSVSRSRAQDSAWDDVRDGGHLVDQADAERVGGREEQPAGRQARALTFPDDELQRAHQDLGDGQADAHLVQPDEERALGEDAVVGVERQHGAARGAVTREGGHHRHG
jgi:hypothetical protein